MIGQNETFNFQQQAEPQASQSFASFDISQQTKSQGYSIMFEVIREHEALVSALSDYSLLFLDINSMKNLCHIPEAHAKRINCIYSAENLLYTCSNDGSIKVWDTKAGTSAVAQIRGKLKFDNHNKSLGPSSQEIYSIASTKHIMAGGSEGNIHFW